MTSLTLANFLLARYAEEEADCREEIADGYGGDQCSSGWSSNRVLAECDALRRIVVRCQEMLSFTSPVVAHLASWVLLDLARPYIDRPDFHEEWKP